MLSKYQIEVTTRCQFSCWYCAGRVMPQKDMEWDTFTSILKQIPTGSTVNLQGEGEPTLWRYWWEGVDAVIAAGCKPEVITNGVAVDVDQMAAKFDTIHISLDTMSPSFAESKIGRFNLMKVIGNVLALKDRVNDPRRIMLMAVRLDESEDGWRAVSSFAAKHGFRFSAQPLQRKEDYVAVYKRPMMLNAPVIANRLTCDVLKAGNKFWTVDGKELPCCFIKVHGGYDRARFEAQWNQGCSPPECASCAHIKSTKNSGKA